MDLPPLQKQVLESIVAQSTRSNGTLDLQQLVSRLPEGAKIQALVQDAQALDAKTRAQLSAMLEKLVEKLASGGTQTRNENLSTPSEKNQSQFVQAETLKAQTNKSLDHLLALLNTPSKSSNNRNAAESQLYAITLKVMGKQALTFSNVMLSPQQRITLTLGENKQVLITPLPTAATAGSQKNTVAAEAHHTQANLHANATKLDTKTPPSMVANTAFNKTNASPTIHQALRQYLPLESSVSSNLNTLQSLLTQLTQQSSIPKALQEHALLKVISSLVNKTPSIHHATHASTLRPAIQNSGANLENKLLNNINSVLNTPRAGGTPSTINTQTTAQGSAPQQPSNIDRDLKAELLKALDIIQQSIPAQSAATNHQRPLVPSAIDKLLLNLFSPRAGTGSSQQSLSAQQLSASVAQLAEAIRPNILAAIARITVNQLRHLSQSMSDGSVAPSGAFMELPIKLGEQLVPMILHIQEKPSPFDEKEKEEDKKRKQGKSTLKKRWHIFMEFDLDQYGKFASDIDYCEPQVKSQIWVEQTPVWELTQKHLHELRQELESNGIEVEELSCHKGKIPSREMKIDQHLVDIRT